MTQPPSSPQPPSGASNPPSPPTDGSLATRGEQLPAERSDSNGREGWGAGPEDDRPMSFWEHLGELRSRLMKAVAAVVVGVGIAWAFIEPVQEILQQPLRLAWARAGLGDAPVLQVLRLQEPFLVDLRIALTTSIFFSGPVIFYQLWMFISPGLYRHEKRFAIPFVLASVTMFTLGSVFAYFVVIPYGFQWLLEYRPEMYSIQPKLEDYVRDTTRLLLAFGTVFEFPLLTAFLAKMGLVHHKMLTRHWRPAMLVIFVIAAILTPPDPMTQTMMAVPLVILYFASVGVAYLLNPTPAEPEPEPEPAQ